jgi:hypothetical protein
MSVGREIKIHGLTDIVAVKEISKLTNKIYLAAVPTIWGS